MEAAVALAAYAVVAVATWPAYTRLRYRALRARHPHTHERDVQHDAVLAAVQGAIFAWAWLPLAVTRAVVLVTLALVRVVLGRSFHRDLSAARTERLEAELAALDAGPARPAPPAGRGSPSLSFDATAVRRLREEIAVADRLKWQMQQMEDVGATTQADALRAELARKHEQIKLLAFDIEHADGIVR